VGLKYKNVVPSGECKQNRWLWWEQHYRRCAQNLGKCWVGA